MFILTAHLLLTLARLARPGGFRVVAAESLAVKHQLLIMKRSRQRAPNLTSWDRLTLGFCALFVSREISIRGSGLENTYQLWGLNLMQDGFTQNQADGFAYLQPVDPDFVQRIEVYKGANALQFGADSLGGAINLVSKTGYNTPLVETNSIGGSFGYVKNYVGSGRVIRPWDYYVGLSDSELGGYRDHSGAVQRRAFLSLGYLAANGMTIRFDANYLHNDEKLPQALTLKQLESNPQQAEPSAVTTNAWRRYDFLRTGVTITQPLGEYGVLELYNQFIWHDLDHTPVYAFLQGSSYDWNSELRYVSTAPLFGYQNKMTAGIQYGGTLVHDLEYVLLPGGHMGAPLRNQWDHALTIGTYAEDDFSLTPKLTLVAGGRMDYSRRSIVGQTSPYLADSTGGTDFFSGISPKLGFIYQITSQTQAFGNISRAYQPPILLEESSPVKERLQNVEDLTPAEVEAVAWSPPRRRPNLRIQHTRTGGQSRPNLFCLQKLHSAHAATAARSSATRAATTATHSPAAHSDAHRAVEIEIRVAGGVDGEHGAPCTSRI